MDPDQFDPRQVTGPARFIGAVFGLIFLGAGLTVIIFLWSAPFGEFGSPPLVFRVFGSFIAIAFVAMGGGTAYGAITGKQRADLMRQLGARRCQPGQSSPESPTPPRTRDGYACDNCGAGLDSSAEVSPHGDVKCAHCGRWFNVHGR